MRKQILFIVVVIFSIFIAGCTAPDKEDEIIIPDTTKVLDDSTLQYISYISGDTSILTFNGRNDFIDNLNIGDNIVSGKSSVTPDGLLREITNINRNGDETILTTTISTIENIIHTGEVSSNISLKKEDIVSSKILLPGIKITQIDKNNKADTYDFLVSIDNAVLYDADENLSTTDDQIIANGSISFDIDYNFAIKIEEFKLQRVSFNVIKTEKIEIFLTSGYSCDFAVEHEIVEYGFNTIVAWIGPVPVVFTPHLVLNVGFNGSITAEINTGITQEATLTNGIAYESSTGDWTLINDFTNNFTYIPPALTLECNSKVYAGPELELNLYGVIGPKFNVYGYLEINATPLEIPAWILYGGLESNIGIEVEVLGKSIVNQQKKLIDIKVILAQDSSVTEEPEETQTPSPETPTPTPHVANSLKLPDTLKSVGDTYHSGYSPVENYIVIFGGRYADIDTDTDKIVIIDLNTNETYYSNEILPAAHVIDGVAYCPAHNSLYLMVETTNDILRWDCTEKKLYTTHPSGADIPSYANNANGWDYDNYSGRIYSTGSYNSSASYYYDPVSNEVVHYGSHPVPGHRSRTECLDNGIAYTFGRQRSGPHYEIYKLNITTHSFSYIQNGFTAGAEHSAYFPSINVIYYWSSWSDDTNLYKFDVATESCSTLTGVAPNSMQEGVQVGDVIIMYGGGRSTFSDNIWIWDPLNNETLIQEFNGS